MKTIKLSQGQVAIVDEDDFDALNVVKWCAAWNPGTRSFYAARGVPIGGGRRTTLGMHRAITGAQKGFHVDHVNRNTLDNRKENLRVCSRSENARNRTETARNTSGFMGVYRHKPSRQWQARIMLKGKLRHLGYFDTALDAAAAYDRACVEMHGAFARHNCTESVPQQPEVPPCS